MIAFFSMIKITVFIITVIHILLNKKDAKSAINWITLVFLSPFMGTFLYAFLGINKIRKKDIQMYDKVKFKKNVVHNMLVKQKKMFTSFKEYYKKFITFEFNVYHKPFLFNNVILPLQNGIEAYPEMLKAIREAKKEVLITSYIFDYDSETSKFLNVFKEIIKKGVKVKILIDGIGTFKFLKRSVENKLAEIKGLEYGVFLSPYIPIKMLSLNLRNHRKMIVIDEEIAFLGGMNLSKRNTMIDNVNEGVLDITFKITGPIIEQIIEVFKNDWEFATGKIFRCLTYNIKKNKNFFGDIPARIVAGGPDNENRIIELIVHGAINMAIKTIIITTPYFLPEENILTAIKMAAMRGVNVEILIPFKSDCVFIDWASEPNFLALLESGVKIYKVPRPFDHSKIFIVDEEWIFVGSANWDVRSFKFHFEANMEMFSKDLAKKLTNIIMIKKKKSKIITIKECRELTFMKRIRNNAYHLLTPYG
ncbi:MAG: cardiolipin synthase [Endomicrobium sp.]|jgi:cardiolipin synthase|nr:cardiolipin synthase [Endomicrobium sp.]